MLTYSISAAKDQFTAVVRQAEDAPIYVSRRGKPVVVMLSVEEYASLQALKPEQSFYETMLAWREEWGIEASGVDPDEVWGDVRDKRPAREVDL